MGMMMMTVFPPPPSPETTSPFGWGGLGGDRRRRGPRRVGGRGASGWPSGATGPNHAKNAPEM